MKGLLFSLLLLSAGALLAQTAPLEVAVRQVQLDAQRLYVVDASGSVRAAPAAVWKVLTAYDKMGEFVPDLASCTLLARSGNLAVVEQYGTARFLFVSHAIHLVVRIEETPMTTLDISLINGNMKHYSAHWELVPIAETGGTRILYRGQIAPDFYVPGFFGAHLIKSNIEDMMRALLKRIDGPAQDK